MSLAMSDQPIPMGEPGVSLALCRDLHGSRTAWMRDGLLGFEFFGHRPAMQLTESGAACHSATIAAPIAASVLHPHVAIEYREGNVHA